MRRASPGLDSRGGCPRVQAGHAIPLRCRGRRDGCRQRAAKRAPSRAPQPFRRGAADARTVPSAPTRRCCRSWTARARPPTAWGWWPRTAADRRAPGHGRLSLAECWTPTTTARPSRRAPWPRWSWLRTCASGHPARPGHDLWPRPQRRRKPGQPAPRPRRAASSAGPAPGRLALAGPRGLRAPGTLTNWTRAQDRVPGPARHLQGHRAARRQ